MERLLLRFRKSGQKSTTTTQKGEAKGWRAPIPRRIPLRVTPEKKKKNQTKKETESGMLVFIFARLALS